MLCCLRHSASVTYFSMLPSASVLVPCILLILRHLKGAVSKNEFCHSPFSSSPFILTSPDIAFYHPPVQLLFQFIKKVGTTFIFTVLYVHINIVTVLDFDSEHLGKPIRQFFYTDLSIIDTVAGIQSIEKLH